MDRNWFYSSLAQSAAAIAGLLGAVLGSRLLQQLDDTRQSKASITQTLEELRGKVAVLLANLRLQRDIDGQALEALRRNLNINIVRGGDLIIDYTGPNGYSSYARERRSLPATEDIITQLEEKQIALDAVLPICEAIVNTASLDDLSSRVIAFQEVQNNSEWSGKQEFQNVMLEMKSLVKWYAAHKAAVLPKSTIIVMFAVIWLVGTGVVWPLTELYSGDDSTLKSVLLIFFVVGLIGIVVYFVFLFRDIWTGGKVELPPNEQ